MKKKLLFSAVVCTVSVAGLLAKDASLDIAFVDSFAAMRECKDGQLVGAEIDKLREVASQELQKDAEFLAKTEADLKTKAAMLKPAELAKQERELAKKKRALEETLQEKEAELKLVMQQKTEDLAVKIEQGIVEVAKAKGVDAVIDKMTGRVMYTKEGNKGDLTQDAIAAIDKKSDLVAQSKKADASTTVAKADSKSKAVTA